jgi:hypothetical protein
MRWNAVDSAIAYATCLVCGRQDIWDAQTLRDWAVIQIQGQRVFVCPNELPKRGITVRQWKAVWMRIIRRLNYMRPESQHTNIGPAEQRIEQRRFS